MPEVSIILPTIRPQCFRECYNAIVKYSEGIDYELLVDSELGGTYPSVRKMEKEATGKYIVHIPDDCVPQEKWLENMLKFMKPHDNEVFEGAFRTINAWEKHGDYLYFDRKFAAFICIRKEVSDKLGGLMDKLYTSFYGDPDLSMRVWNAGGIVEHCNDAVIFYPDCLDDRKFFNKRTYEKEDEQKFIERWEPIFGKYEGCKVKPVCW
jgi:GT2 family glycosyltransferase